MSLFSRFFGKTSPPAPPPASAASTPPARPAGTASPKAGAADRATAAATEERALQAALDTRDFQAVARLVADGSSTRIRQAAAEAIEDPDLLRQLIRDVRGGKDKSVYKILTAKRDAQLEQLRQQERLRVQFSAAAADLEDHSRRPYDATYSAQLDHFESRWQELAAQADPDQGTRARQAIERARQIVADHHRQLAAEAARAQAASEAAAQAQRLREEEAQASAAAAAEQARLLDEQQRTPDPQQEAERQAIRQVGDLIRKARAALNDGSTSRAATVRRAIEEKLAQAPTLPPPLLGQIQQLDQKLDELRDWKRFSVAPKRAELIEQMEALVGASLDPLALAEQIKHLKDEWRSLGKGAGDHLEAEAQRFQDAAQKAYLPCKEYFAAQALVHQENQQRREAVLAALAAFEAACNWDRPDWRAVIHTLRQAKQEWRSCSPVDPQAARPQQETFSALVTRLQARVDDEHARNVKEKESLIDRARALLSGEDVRKAIDAVKGLQQQWQAVGPVPREVDQRLWGQFRQHCDAVFQKREQETAAHTAGLENNKTQALALCEQLEALAALDGPELLAGAGARVELKKAFEAISELPRADTRELRNRFERGLERLDASLARLQARDAEQAWHQLFEAANHVRAYRLALARDRDPEQLGALKDAAETFIAAVPRWPRRGLETIRRALAAGPAGDLAANEAALKMLCIRAEIQADLPTPPEDQALRREYQLQRLVQGLGQGQRADDTQWDSLAMEWVAAGPVEEAAYEPLRQRFWRCRDAGKAKSR